MEKPLRHEYKFPIGQGEYLGLRSRLSVLLHRDSHAGSDGFYRIRSVYFDNTDDKALREKLDGLPRREKFRVRWYNGDNSFILLEKKSKINGLCSKESCLLTADEAKRLFTGNTGWMRSDPRELVKELAVKMDLQGLRPRTVVDYDREAFIFAPGNVRVTLDSNIRSAPFRPDVLEHPLATVPAGGSVLLEVKYDRFLPEIVRMAVQLDSRSAGAFSKYAAARGYN